MVKVENHTGLVFHIYNKKFSSWGRFKEDMIGEGLIALVKASKKFNTRRKCKFSTYAGVAIQRAMFRVLQTKVYNDPKLKFIDPHLLIHIMEQSDEQTTKDEIRRDQLEEIDDIFAGQDSDKELFLDK